MVTDPVAYRGSGRLDDDSASTRHLNQDGHPIKKVVLKDIYSGLGIKITELAPGIHKYLKATGLMFSHGARGSTH